MGFAHALRFRIVARHVVHELVGVIRTTRIRSRHGADGNNLGMVVLELRRSFDRVVGDLGFESVARRGRTIAIEDGQFLCTGAARIQLLDRMLQAEVGSRGTARFQRVDGGLFLLQILRRPSQGVHRLGIVIVIPVLIVRVVADFIGVLACILDQRDLHLLAGVVDTLVLILNLVQEVRDRILQRIQASLLALLRFIKLDVW